MMADTTTEKVECAVCGAEVREGSLFCYNCGGSVDKESPSGKNSSDGSKTAEPQQLAEADSSEPASNDRPTAVKPPPATPPLRSAASLRRRSQSLRRQPVEVSWEPAGESSTAFIVATVVFGLLALALFLIALYLR